MAYWGRLIRPKSAINSEAGSLEARLRLSMSRILAMDIVEFLPLHVASGEVVLPSVAV